MGFAAEQLERVRVEWQEMLAHPFLRGTRDGTIPFDTFATWMRQDYLYVDGAIPFVSILLAKAPEKHRAAHSRVIGMLQKELELLRERAATVGVDLSNLAPSIVNHAYIQFLLATAYREIADLQKELDELAAHAGAAERARMAELFELTVRYELVFWEMAWTAGGWPRASVASGSAQGS